MFDVFTKPVRTSDHASMCSIPKGGKAETLNIELSLIAKTYATYFETLPPAVEMDEEIVKSYLTKYNLRLARKTM